MESKVLITNSKNFTGSLEDCIFKRFSSSTSGKPKQVFLTKEDLDNWKINGRLTITPYFKEGMTLIHSKRKEKYYLSALDEAVEYSKGKVKIFNPEDVLDVLEKIKEADILLEYSEMIYFISHKLSKLREKINLNKELIISYTGEYLSSDDINKIKTNFEKVGIKTKIYSEYSLSEIGPVACSHDNKNNLFELIYNKICFVEIVNEENINSPEGEIIITALNRRGTNLIRYKTGDIGELVFKNKKPFILLKGRKTGIKISSLFISPKQISNLIQDFFGSPLFIYITIKKESYFGIINIKIISPEKIEEIQLNNLKQYLLEELDYIDDIGKTMNLDISFENRNFQNKEFLKRYSYKFIN